MNYYVYAYLREDGTPYYVGKGKGRRAYDTNHSIGLPPRDRIVFLETNLTNIGACAIERRMIEWYGRKDLGTGILRNKTDGGDGTEGYTHTEETKAHLKIVQGDAREDRRTESKARWEDPEYRSKMLTRRSGCRSVSVDSIRHYCRGLYSTLPELNRRQTIIRQLVNEFDITVEAAKTHYDRVHKSRESGRSRLNDCYIEQHVVE